MRFLVFVFAQQVDQPSVWGWFVGFVIGFVVILVVVILVASILHSASHINRGAREAVNALRDGYRNTLPLWDVARIHREVRGISAAARTVRSALGG